MTRYEYAEVHYDGSEWLTLRCSDSTVGAPIAANVNELVRKCQITECRDETGETFRWDIRIRQFDKVTDLMFWAAAQLCERGWEPFAAFRDKYGSTTAVHFGLKRDEHDNTL